MDLYGIIFNGNTKQQSSIFLTTIQDTYLHESCEKGGLKQGTPLCRLLRNACSASFCSHDGSIRQNEPLPGSSCARGTFTK